MLRVLIFNLLQIGVTAYAVRRGGAPERIVGIALLLGAIGTRLLQSELGRRFVTVESGVAIVDLTLFAALLVVVLAADRFWPLWMSALQAIGAASHLVRFADAEVLRVVYAFLSASVSYPMIAILALATWRHRRRAEAFGLDRDWSHTPPRASSTLREARPGRADERRTHPAGLALASNDHDQVVRKR